jgi:hypothetical protein
MEPWLKYGYRLPVVEVPLYWESTPRIKNKVVKDSKCRIDRADHRFWNGMDKSARTFFILYIFRQLSRVVFLQGTTVGGSP